MGVVAPAATPKEIVDLLHRQIAAILKLPDIAGAARRRSATQPVGSTPDEFCGPHQG